MAAPSLPAPMMRASASGVSMSADPASFVGALLDEISSSGAAAHDYIFRIAATRESFADTVHFLCLLHGNQPDIAELAAVGLAQGAAAIPTEAVTWLHEVSRAFTPDRLWLAQLAVLAGYPTRSFGLTSAENIARAQREAMLTLAQSGRAGCALGAAVSFALDWSVIRSALNKAAENHLVLAPLPPLALPETERLVAMLVEAAATEGARRAVRFGAVQMLALHRGLWDLLESRGAAALS